jgi:hypothetical protein
MLVTRGVAEIQLRTLADPGFERLVVKLARHGELAAFMRHGCRWLSAA